MPKDEKKSHSRERNPIPIEVEDLKIDITFDDNQMAKKADNNYDYEQNSFYDNVN